jgi:hypothetical protein
VFVSGLQCSLLVVLAVLLLVVCVDSHGQLDNWLIWLSVVYDLWLSDAVVSLFVCVSHVVLIAGVVILSVMACASFSFTWSLIVMLTFCYILYNLVSMLVGFTFWFPLSLIISCVLNEFVEFTT